MLNNAHKVHPGEVLFEEFLKPLGLSQNGLARKINVPPRRVNEIVLGKRSVTPDSALRLARYFDTSSRFWLGLQTDHDLEEAQLSRGEEIARSPPSTGGAGLARGTSASPKNLPRQGHMLRLAQPVKDPGQ